MARSRLKHQHLVCALCSVLVLNVDEPNHKVKRRFPLDAVVGESSTIIELPASKHQALLIERDAWGARQQQQEPRGATATGHESWRHIDTRGRHEPSLSWIFCLTWRMVLVGSTSSVMILPMGVLMKICIGQLELALTADAWATDALEGAE